VAVFGGTGLQDPLHRLAAAQELLVEDTDEVAEGMGERPAGEPHAGTGDLVAVAARSAATPNIAGREVRRR
jgi:hypothetical protein